VRLYPTREAFAIQVERHLDAAARNIADAYRCGYADGNEQGYVTGYTEGANETLRIAKRSVRRGRGREVEIKAWVQ
jgi:flagellar biosynthesis/type III secretory pathway protein FliH